MKPKDEHDQTTFTSNESQLLYSVLNNVFITYNNPTELKSKQNRRAVSSFASKSYRPTSKRIVLDRTHYRPFILRQNGETPRPTPTTTRPSPPSTTKNDRAVSRSNISNKQWALLRTPEQVLNVTEAQPRSDCVLGSPMVDPFTTYPITFRTYIPFLVDYFLRYLTARFSPALAVVTSRYTLWFKVAMQNSELFHALIALSQVYYNIDIKGFGNTHWTALYHRGEALKQLRRKVETSENPDDDAAILTALWLMDVDAAHGDLQAYAMHTRAKERMVSNRGGITSLPYELQDELLKSEFFLPLLLHGKFVCEVTIDNDVLVRFRANDLVEADQVESLQGALPAIASKGLLTTQAVEILQQIYTQLKKQPEDTRSDRTIMTASDDTQLIASNNDEIRQVLELIDKIETESLQHHLLLGLLIYIFNLHNQPTVLPGMQGSSSSPPSNKTRQSYLETLSALAQEMSQPQHRDRPGLITEREVTLWTMVAIGSASSFSPWRLQIPFMGHLIELMEDDTKETALPLNTVDGKSGRYLTNLGKLTSTLRGYYLYGADKNTLRSLQKWKD